MNLQLVVFETEERGNSGMAAFFKACNVRMADREACLSIFRHPQTLL